MDFGACRPLWVRHWWQSMLHDHLLCLKLHRIGTEHVNCRFEDFSFLNRYVLASPDLSNRHIGAIVYSANCKKFKDLYGLERFFV